MIVLIDADDAGLESACALIAARLIGKPGRTNVRGKRRSVWSAMALTSATERAEGEGECRRGDPYYAIG